MYDLIVIGSGPGGYVAALRAAKLGLKTACIEEGKTLGGTCLNVGCIPSKCLLESSHLFEQAKDLHAHGIEVDPKLDFKKMMQRKERVVAGLTEGVDGLFQQNHVEKIAGTATFTAPDTVKVGKETLQARHFIVATGSAPVELPFLPFDNELVISSTEALSLQEVPKSLIVVGAGVIGVELASVYRRLGADVILVEMLDEICAGLDPLLTRTLQKSLTAQGLTFHLSSKVVEAKKYKHLVHLKVKRGADLIDLKGTVVLVAVGRKPHTEKLGLDSMAYNKAVHNSIEEQLLLNIVRLRYQEAPTFLEYGIISSSYEFERNLSTSWEIEINGNGVSQLMPDAGLVYIEKPTITLEPLCGEGLVTEWLSPISFDTLAVLYRSGWDIERLFRCCIQRLNRLKNVPNNTAFEQVASSLGELDHQDALQLLVQKNPDTSQVELLYIVDPSFRHSAAWKEVRQGLKLTFDADRFRLVTFRHHQDLEENIIRVETRSPMSILQFLSQGVYVPKEHVECHYVADPSPECHDGLFRIYWSRTKPKDAVVCICHNGLTFYLSSQDIATKTTFALLHQLLALQHSCPSTPTITTIPLT